MADIAHPQPTVIRTSRGLSIAGRRLTLYSIMDYLQAGWPPHLVCDEFNLTDKQMADVLSYMILLANSPLTRASMRYHLPALQKAIGVCARVAFRPTTPRRAAN